MINQFKQNNKNYLLYALLNSYLPLNSYLYCGINSFAKNSPISLSAFSLVNSPFSNLSKTWTIVGKNLYKLSVLLVLIDSIIIV